MKKFVVANHEISIPEGWHEVRIDQYQKLASLKNEDVDDITKLIDIISILSDTDSSIVERIGFDMIPELSKALMFYQLPPEKRYDKFELNGVEYGLLTNLPGITMAEWMDLEHFIKDYIANVHIILAIIYRPVKERKRSLKNLFSNSSDYEILDYDSGTVMKRAELFRKNLTWDMVAVSLVFFSHTEKMFMNNILNSLEEQKKMMEKEMSLVVNQKEKESKD